MNKPTVTVEHIGEKSDGGFATSRLMVNGHGVANWRSYLPVTDDANGKQYAEEVARCLRVALGIEPPKARRTNLVFAPNGMVWGPHSLAPFRRMVKYLGRSKQSFLGQRGQVRPLLYELSCGHVHNELGPSVDMTNLRRARRRCQQCKKELDAQYARQQKKKR